MLFWATVCVERYGETTVLTDDVVGGAGDVDLGELCRAGDGGDRNVFVILAAVAFRLALDLRLRLAYLDVSVRDLPVVGRFQ